MRHFTCRDCGTGQGCGKVIQLFEDTIALHPETEAMWCPLCLMKQLGLTGDQEREIFSDLVCHDCGGDAGRNRLIDVNGARGFHIRFVDAEAGREYLCYPTMGDFLGHAADIARVGGGGLFTPPPRKVITLEPGEKRCLCNNCERLTVQLAGA